MLIKPRLFVPIPVRIPYHCSMLGAASHEFRVSALVISAEIPVVSNSHIIVPSGIFSIVKIAGSEVLAFEDDFIDAKIGGYQHNQGELSSRKKTRLGLLCSK